MEFLIDKVFSLKTVSVFENLPEASLLDIARIMEYEEIPAGREFIKKGEIGDCMYIIKSGRVKVHDGESEFAQLGENEIVGELALLTPIPRTASVSTLEDSLVYIIGRDYFMDLLYEKSEILSEIIQVLIRRIISLNDEIAKLKA